MVSDHTVCNESRVKLELITFVCVFLILDSELINCSSKKSMRAYVCVRAC